MTAAREPSAIGFFGGTFDPVHAGHVCVARAAVAEMHLDYLHVAPCGSPAHRAAALAAGRHRMDMLHRAFSGEHWLRLDDRELRRDGPSYTLISIRELCEEYRVERVWLVIGEDAVRMLPDWEAPTELLSHVHLAVAGRAAACPGGEDWRQLAADAGASVHALQVQTPDVSATRIRTRLQNGQTVEDMLAPAVIEYIQANHLYGAGSMRVDHP